MKEMSALEEKDDKDYYIDFLGCILCKQEFISFISLFIHIKITHEDFKCFLSQPSNNETRLTEGHIIIYPSQFSSRNSILTDDDKNFHFLRDENKQMNTLLKYVAEADIKYKPDLDNFNGVNCNINRNNKGIVYTSAKGKDFVDKNNLGNDDLNFARQSKTVYRSYKDNLYPNERLFFHSVTGEILSENSDDSDYDIDNDDILEYEAKDIDHFTDICQKDKEFFKIWNKYMENNK